ncbi:hypothetical protein U27_04250 [Candidatus Vecturithrix granuli]|uniref:STAS/SEC14 domain-containing protein n=1 Tax=Vecturithrix granuli TaxID=1499967 RepID=A0A081BY80_VECG1|nr:hypothetical protein U27_04250 [Candidatus Vecturithrix granuli]
MKPLPQDIFYEKPEFAVCWYDKELEAIVQEFETVTYWTPELIETYKQMQDAMLQALSRYHATKWLCLAGKWVRATPPEVQKWIEQVVAPGVIERGLKYFAEVMPGSAITRFSTQKWQEGVQTVIRGQMTLANFSTEQEARAWLQQQQ